MVVLHSAGIYLSDSSWVFFLQLLKINTEIRKPLTYNYYYNKGLKFIDDFLLVLIILHVYLFFKIFDIT